MTAAAHKLGKITWDKTRRVWAAACACGRWSTAVPIANEATASRTIKGDHAIHRRMEKNK